LHRQAGYDPFRSYEPIALVAESSNILVVKPSVPATSVQELVAYANPEVNFSSGRIGVLPHHASLNLSLEIETVFIRSAGLDQTRRLFARDVQGLGPKRGRGVPRLWNAYPIRCALLRQLPEANGVAALLRLGVPASLLRLRGAVALDNR
jgi:hypothetical protein